MTYAVGDELVACVAITGRDDFYGHQHYASPGDHLIIHKIISPMSYDVSKVGCTDSFWVRDYEVELFRKETT